MSRTEHVISTEHLTYHFGPDLDPVAAIEPGDVVTLETLDASSGRVPGGMDVVDYTRVRDPNRVNPATGPIAVRGAEVGDELWVEILAIDLGDVGWARLTPGSGVMRDEIAETVGMIFRREGDELVCPDGLRLPTRPMVGVIGTCPATGRYSTGGLGPHGGNLDFSDMTIGTLAHLPVWVPGGLFALGDVHASMGDAEVSGTAVEICARVRVRIDLVKGTRLDRPWYETADAWMTWGAAPDLEEAVRQAVAHMASFLQARLGVTRAEAFLLVTARGDVRIGQSARCGIDQTARVLFPKLAR
ncbi:MAG: acetamidase/formamidase family protein [Chloroflexota bacterium]|nr:acetamidase/formamidase family protein [Chloroflexota bacterium]